MDQVKKSEKIKIYVVIKMVVWYQLIKNLVFGL